MADQADAFVTEEPTRAAAPNPMLKTVGMILLAVLAGTVAWLLSSLVKL